MHDVNFASFYSLGGPALSLNKKFVDKLKSVVYDDHLSQAKFEESWHRVISEYKLENNNWFTY